MMETFKRLHDEAVRLQKDGVPPESEKGQNLAKAFWDMVMEFTGGDLNMLSKLIETENIIGPDKEWKQKQVIAYSFIEPALEAYFTELGLNPFEEVPK